MLGERSHSSPDESPRDSSIFVAESLKLPVQKWTCPTGAGERALTPVGDGNNSSSAVQNTFATYELSADPTTHCHLDDWP
jgi:hypothetical protein